MTTYKQGDIVLVPFPFTDLSTTKRRPALVVSADWFNDSKIDCVLVGVTSQIPFDLGKDEFLLDQHDLTRAGLPLASIIKVGKIVTIQQNLIVKKIGQLPAKTLEQLLNLICEIVLNKK